MAASAFAIKVRDGLLAGDLFSLDPFYIKNIERDFNEEMLHGRMSFHPLSYLYVLDSTSTMYRYLSEHGKDLLEEGDIKYFKETADKLRRQYELYKASCNKLCK